jgi:hypothetical protein
MQHSLSKEAALSFKRSNTLFQKKQHSLQKRHHSLSEKAALYFRKSSTLFQQKQHSLSEKPAFHFRKKQHSFSEKVALFLRKAALSFRKRSTLFLKKLKSQESHKRHSLIAEAALCQQAKFLPFEGMVLSQKKTHTISKKVKLLLRKRSVSLSLSPPLPPLLSLSLERSGYPANGEEGAAAVDATKSRGNGGRDGHSRYSRRRRRQPLRPQSM